MQREQELGIKRQKWRESEREKERGVESWVERLVQTQMTACLVNAVELTKETKHTHQATGICALTGREQDLARLLIGYHSYDLMELRVSQPIRLQSSH